MTARLLSIIIAQSHLEIDIAYLKDKDIIITMTHHKWKQLLLLSSIHKFFVDCP